MTWNDMKWHEMTWQDKTWHDMTWHDMTWNDMKWHHMKWNEMTWNDMKWHEMTWHEMTWNDMKWHEMTWHDMTWNEMISPIAFRLKFRQKKLWKIEHGRAPKLCLDLCVHPSVRRSIRSCLVNGFLLLKVVFFFCYHSISLVLVINFPSHKTTMNELCCRYLLLW